jgi:L-amino acid N-acyltransferase YncA
MEDVKLRDATHDDLPRIVEIYNSTIPSRMVTADLVPVTVASKEAWFHEHNPINRPLWVVINQENICGWLSFQDFKKRHAYHQTIELSIYLDEQYRGQGLGRYLLAEAIDIAPSLGVETIIGLIFGHNLPSLKLFASFGFEKWGHLPEVAELDGVKRDLIMLGKRI